MKNTILDKFKQDLENKKIAIWGLGKEGISTLQFIQSNNIKCKELGILEKKEFQEIEGTKKLDKIEDLNEYDLIFKSPGIVADRATVDIDKLTSQTEEFIKILSKQIIGITGTKGKSTTSSLTYTILKKYYPNTVLVGNIGIPCFNAINEIDENTKIVFELSCHQLEFIRYSPHIAVILDLYPDHLDHYKTFENYIKAKLNINKFQKDDDIFIYGETCKKYIKNDDKNVSISESKNNICINDYIKGRTINIGTNSIQILEDETRLVGDHNFFDIAVSYYICNEVYNLSNEEFKSALKEFKGLAHRLEYITTSNDVKYYDDSISTIGETTIEGIKALKDVNTLILGGMERKIDYSSLEDFIIEEKELENIILMPDTGIRIYKELQEKEIEQKEGIAKEREEKQENSKNYYLVNNLEEAVKKAKEVTKKGTSCLLSPAAASYGFFKNFEERGNTFQNLVLG